MVSITMTFLLALLAVSSVSCKPLGLYQTAQYWAFKYPQLNASLIDFCYFNKTEWTGKPEADSDYWCKLVTKPTTEDFARYPKELLLPMHDLYKRYVEIGLKDQTDVLSCFVQNRFEDEAKRNSCTVINSELEWNTVKRQSRSNEYFDLLSQVSTQINNCWDKINYLVPVGHSTQHCSDEIIDVLTLVHHCTLYHTSKLMIELEVCEKMLNNSTTLPTDFNSVAVYLERTNMQRKIAENYWPFTRSVSKVNGRQRKMLFDCFNSNEWLDQPAHLCHKITTPRGDVNYTRRMRILQVEWQQVTSNLLKDDCTEYHRYLIDDDYHTCSHFVNVVVE